ncbi:MAG: 2-C-methyl-D-erythritol 4-phosphate cytidylyltransferase [Fusobacteriaceae bacterium]|nr:2-C-methyl-D-erythritol 4-phosphate cytidylyltransferase [Fusobacteriaceae bacterium]
MHGSHAQMKVVFVVAAAGAGTRMGAGFPKQFLTHGGKALFLWPTLCAEKCAVVDAIFVISPGAYVEKIRDLCAAEGITKLRAVVPGGSERQESIRKTLEALESYDPDPGTLIFIQDGVRIFCKEKYITECAAALEADETLDGLVVGVPVKDTIKIVDEAGFIVNTPERKRLFAANTPQVFRWGILKRAYDEAARQGRMSTDDAQLVEAAGGRVRILPGDYDNVKITTEEDLRYLDRT